MGKKAEATILPSLIITTYNWKEALSLTLMSVLQQTRTPFEVIIADDGSREDTGQVVRAFAEKAPCPIRHIWQEDAGFRLAQIRNRAIAAARGNYIILIDGDIIIEQHFVADHMTIARTNFLLQGSRVLLSSACSGKLLSTQTLPACFFSTGVANRKNCLRSPLLSGIFSWKSTSYMNVRTCNFSFWKKDAIAVNGFDEKFVGWGREDSEFTARMLYYGIRRRNVRFRATAYHLYHPMNDRRQLAANDHLLRQTVKNKRTWCDNGLAEYLT